MVKTDMLSFDLGSSSFTVGTDVPTAQKFFDQGIKWCFGFNQEEGLACFKKGLNQDPNCAMLHWGVAYAAGPFYNMPWNDFSEPEAIECTAFCRNYLNKAIALFDSATPLERALINALSLRVQKSNIVSKPEYDAWDYAYANAMNQVNTDFPDNQFVMALCIEAMMTRTPWNLWNIKTGLPTEEADTDDALKLCEHAIRLADHLGEEQHPAILHLHIHLLEMSPEPERALSSADRLFGLCPDAGHIQHMPAHIYVLSGDYEKAKAVSEAAILADRKYLSYAGPYNFYTTARCHDLHMMINACMMLGQFKPAMAAADEICENLPLNVIDLKDKPFITGTMEGYFAMRMHVLVRFGKWQEIIDVTMPEQVELYCVTTSMHHYAKTIALSVTAQFDKADTEKKYFYESLERISPDRKLFNNSAPKVLAVGEKMLLGEMEYHKDNYEVAFSYLRESVKRYDNLHYSEPWPWMHPPRHALGALLLEQGHYEEAEEVYRVDLGLNDKAPRCTQHKNNVWAMHGLVECLKARNEEIERNLLQGILTEALSKTDLAITSSCCCRKTVRTC